MPAPYDEMTAALAALRDQGTATEAFAALDSWKPLTWKKILLDLPIDEHAHFERFQASRRTDIERLWQWWSKRGAGAAQPSPQTTGYLGFLLLTLVAVHGSDRARFHGETAGSVKLADTDATRICAALVKDKQVREAIRELYRPPRARMPRRSSNPSTAAEWDKIDFSSLAFHRHGTTSIILQGTERDTNGGRRAQVALKCIIYPYLKIDAVRTATRQYCALYSQPDASSSSSPLVHVWASHDSWILMDYLEGKTLAERLRERAAARPTPKREILRPVDIELLDDLGTALLDALTDLERLKRTHNDLTPSNILLVEPSGSVKPQIRFIDLGVNHLHTRALPGAAQGEAVFVAPEVRSDGTDRERSDLYSLGLLLVAIGGIRLNADGTLPDQFYVASVGMARLLEDLIDTDPGRRLLVHAVPQGKGRFEHIRDLFANEMEVLRESAREAPVGWFEKLKSVSPGAGTVARQRKILRVRRRQRAYAASDHLRLTRRLNRWALLCSFLVWATMAAVITWWARDFGVSWQARWFEWLNILFNRSGPGMVFFDDIRAPDYPIPDPVGNLPVRLIGFTFALVNARLYLNVFAEMSPLSTKPRRGMLRVRTLATEASLRTFAVLPSICVLVPTLVQRDWWPLATQIGIVSAAIVVSSCLWFQRDTHRRARAAGLSTVPDVEVPPGRLGQWHPTLLLYCVPILSIGVLIMLDVLKDELVYACFVSLINIAIYYFRSAGTDAPMVRTELSRAFLAAERLDHLAEREAPSLPEPRPESDAPAPVPV
jgi:hypothetical protein